MAKSKTASEHTTVSKKIPVKAASKSASLKKKPKSEFTVLPTLIYKNCSFCGKPSGYTNILIAGPPPVYANICYECVESCVKILLEAEPQEWSDRLTDILSIQKKKKAVLPKKKELK